MSDTPITDIFVALVAAGISNEKIVEVIRVLETQRKPILAVRPGDRRRAWDRARKAKLPADWAVITQAVFERDGYACTYCGDEPGDLHCDHVVPLSRGGTSDMDNLTTACVSCNMDKGSKLLSEWPFYQEYILGVTAAK